MSKHIMARLRQAELLSKVSPCPRGQVGAVLFEPKSWVIISDGYNGPPRGGGFMCGGDYCERDRRGIESGTMTEVGCHHAEANAIVNAARRGHSTMGSWLAVTRAPCLNCAKMIHHAGVERVYISTTIKHLIGDGVTHLVNHQVEVKLWSSMKT